MSSKDSDKDGKRSAGSSAKQPILSSKDSDKDGKRSAGCSAKQTDVSSDSDSDDDAADTARARKCIGKASYEKCMKAKAKMEQYVQGQDRLRLGTHEVTDAHQGHMISDVQYCTHRNETLNSIAAKLGMDGSHGAVVLWLFNHDVDHCDNHTLKFPGPSRERRGVLKKKTIVYVPKNFGQAHRKSHFKEPSPKDEIPKRT